MQEKRRFIRLSLDPPLKVKTRFVSSEISLELASETEALIKNISVGGGLLIELVLKSKEEEDNLLAGKEKIYIETRIPTAAIPIKILGKVAWLKKMDKSGLFYEAGTSFENIDAKTQENILHIMIDLAFKQNSIKT